MKKVSLLALAGLVGAQAVFAHTGPASQATNPAHHQHVATGIKTYNKAKAIEVATTPSFRNERLLEFGAKAILRYIKSDYRTMLVMLADLPFFMVVPNHTKAPDGSPEIATTYAVQEPPTWFRADEYVFCQPPAVPGNFLAKAW